MSDSTIVLITGANSGVGYATTEAIVSQPGFHVILACRDPAKGNQARAELLQKHPKGSLSVLQLDVEDDNSIAQAVKSVTNEFGRVDAFISNAGTTAVGASGREKLQRTFSANVFGAMMVTEAFIPLLLQSKQPRLVQISSGLGSLGLASDLSSPYAASPWDEYRMSKAALNMMTIQMHKRLMGKNVRVFAYCPGLVRSRLRGESEEEVSAQGRAGDPMVPGRGLLDIVAGRRDEEAGQFLSAACGVFPW
ncbi:Uncharacterized protein PECH_001287 [Penicillium ucsense]|uniref:Uncharacterized protein n=1 Tax=Penicillium ucsense TaxID=2839758 RepID=A0A8J8VX85_9EURO|nr:Uncharacterized protein PECM_002324 [Penicillium ucsense]KAF7732978.1 Uncharacterized protein PECH_001287 [Penicillium ucsense]